MNNLENFYGMMPNNDFNYFNNMNMIPDYNQNTFMPYNYDNNIYDNNLDITTPEVGFIRGNMFDNLYDPYKNYKPLVPQDGSERESLLNGIREYAFALTDLDLFLDTHPKNQEAINLYNNCLKEENKLRNEYEQKYGPLSLDSKYQNPNSWAWIQEPWPWEGDK